MGWTVEPTTDGFIVCPKDGDLYWCEGAGPGTALEASTLSPLRGDISLPVSGQEMLCPLCRASVHPEIRRRVVVIPPKGSSEQASS